MVFHVNFVLIVIIMNMIIIKIVSKDGFGNDNKNIKGEYQNE